MGYSYVYPPLKQGSSAKTGIIEALPTSPPASNPISVSNSKPVKNSLIPKLNAPKEFQNFLDNIGNKFKFPGGRREPERIGTLGDMSSKPSKQVPRVRKRPNQPKRKRLRQGNLPRRRADPGNSRSALRKLMDMDVLGKFGNYSMIIIFIRLVPRVPSRI